jgi:hypothetical protein
MIATPFIPDTRDLRIPLQKDERFRRHCLALAALKERSATEVALVSPQDSTHNTYEWKYV